MAKRKTPVTPIITPVVPETAAPATVTLNRPVVNNPKVDALHPITHSPVTLAGLKAGKVIKDAEGGVHAAWIAAAREAFKLDAAGRGQFVDGFGSAWSNTSTAKVRMSELRTIVHAMDSNMVECERLFGNLMNGSTTRILFMSDIRVVSPKVTGQGARTDTPQAAAVTAGTGEAVQAATKRAELAKVAKQVKSAQKLAKTRPGPVIDAATVVVPSATPEQQAKLVQAVASAVTPAPDADVKLVRFMITLASRLVDVTTDAAVKDYAAKVVSMSELLVRRMQGQTSSTPVTPSVETAKATGKARQRKAA